MLEFVVWYSEAEERLLKQWRPPNTWNLLWIRPTTGQLRLAGSVGVCGLLADGHRYPKTIGGKPELVAVFGCDRRVVSSSCGAHPAPGDSKPVCGGRCCGEHSGGNWMASQPCVASLQGAGRCDFGHLSVNYAAAFVSGRGRPLGPPSRKLPG